MGYEMEDHPIGTLSPTGVLDVGLRCPHSCIFCYYSHFDGHKDQFHALRTLPFRETAECKEIVDDFQSWGLTHCDITGGEPTLHPDIVEIVRYIETKKDIRARLITLAQFLLRKNKKGGRILVEDLLDAGLTDFLFSFHASTEDRMRQITGASLAKTKKVMEYLDALSITYTANTVVQEYNYSELPDIARYLADRNIRFHNFIIMKLEWGWRHASNEGTIHKARYSDVAPHLYQAVHILEDAGVYVNVRYAPYCSFPGLEKNIVGYKQVQLDPYEWRNGVRGGAAEGKIYGNKPFLMYETLEDYLNKHPTDVETLDSYNMCHGPPCSRCSLRQICDGVDRDYIAKNGWREFSPYDGAEITDLSHFRSGYTGPYRMITRRVPHPHGSHGIQRLVEANHRQTAGGIESDTKTVPERAKGRGP